MVTSGDLVMDLGDRLAISIRRLSKRYGRLLAVDDLSLEVHPGEIFGFLGRPPSCSSRSDVPS